MLVLKTPDKTCSELARGMKISLVRKVLFAALKNLLSEFSGNALKHAVNIFVK